MMTLRYYFDEPIEDGLYGPRALEIMKKIIEDKTRLLPQMKDKI